MLFFLACSIYSTVQQFPNNLSLEIGNFHLCKHDHFASLLTKDSLKSIKTKSIKIDGKLKLDQKFRLVFDYQHIDTPDQWTCKSESDQITWNIGTIQCRKEDLITEEKKKFVKETYNNVATYLSKLLKVHPTSPYLLEDYPINNKHYPQRSGGVDNADLYLFVYARPFGDGSTILASAFSTNLDDKSNGRPFIGIIHHNFANIPDHPGPGQSEKSEDRSVFEVALHEVIHALGFDSTLFPRYVDKANDKIYDNQLPLYECYNTSYPSRKFQILATPKIRQVMSEMFGQDKLDLVNSNPNEKSCPIGAILEDNGEQGTAGSHFELVTHLSDIMNGMTFGVKQSISNLTLALLEDTGFYAVDYQYAEPLYYGDYRANYERKKADKPYTNFLTAPPQLVFPEHYTYHTGEEQQRCSFDHRYYGTFPLEEYSCPSTVCDLKDYVDPLHTGRYSSQPPLNNYIPIVVPFTIKDGPLMSCRTLPIRPEYMNSNADDAFCVETARTKQTESHGLCYRMTCNENQLTVHVGDKSGVCSKKGDIATINSIDIQCPDPNVICGMINYNKESSVEPVASSDGNKPEGGGSDDLDSDPDDGLTDGQIAGIVIGVILGVALIVVFTVIYFKRRGRNNERSV